MEDNNAPAFFWQQWIQNLENFSMNYKDAEYMNLKQS